MPTVRSAAFVLVLLGGVVCADELKTPSLEDDWEKDGGRTSHERMVAILTDPTLPQDVRVKAACDLRGSIRLPIEAIQSAMRRDLAPESGLPRTETLEVYFNILIALGDDKRIPPALRFLFRKTRISSGG
jgi:hypothetical protein